MEFWAKIAACAVLTSALCLVACDGDSNAASAKDDSGNWVASSAAMFLSSSGNIPRSSSNVKVGSSASVKSSSSRVKPSSSKVNVQKGTMTDARDGQSYNTVTIGERTWLAQNLNFAYNNGSAKSYCPDNAVLFCGGYGRLYTWAAAMDSAGIFSENSVGCGDGVSCGKECKPASFMCYGNNEKVRGVCPEGWHVPSFGEWKDLFAAVGGGTVAQKALMSKDTWPSFLGTDKYGFNGISAGYAVDSVRFSGRGEVAFFWTSVEMEAGSAQSANSAYLYEMTNKAVDAGIRVGEKKIAGSLRCVKDE